MVKNIPAIERSTEIRFGKHVPDSTDQADNTIVFNASNVLVPTPYSNAVYLSPIRNRPDFSAPEVVLLMYDRNTKEITESGESANNLVGGATLSLAVDRANVTSNTVQFTGGGHDDNNVAFVTDSNVGISNLLPQHTVSVGSNLYIDEFGSNVLVVSGNVAVLRDMVIDGNLRVNGDTTVIYAENTAIKDAFIELGQNNTSEDTTLDLGVLMHRPDALSNVVIGYREESDEFAIGYTDAKPTDKIFTPKSDEDINVHVYGLTHVDANIYAHEDLVVDGNVYVSQNVSVTEELTVSGNVYADKDLEVVGNTYVSGNVEVTKDLIVTGNTHLEGPNVFITHTMDFLDPTTAIVTDLNSNVEVKLNQLANVVIGTKALANEDMLVYDGSNWTNQLQNHTFLHAKAEEVIAKGDAVYATGTVGNNTFSIRKAQSNSSATMPALGLAYQAFTLNQEGLIVTFGRSDGINTDNFQTGETVYVSNVTAGALSNVKPYGATDLIQNIGLVVKGHPSTGIVSVTGVGRSNDIPNAVIETSNASVNYVYVNSVNNDLRKIDPMKLPTKLQPLTNVVNTGNTAANAVTLRGLSITSGNGFNGDLTVTGNVSIDNDTLAVDSISHRVGLKTTSPNSNLHVVGNVFVTSNITTSSNIFVVGEAAATSKTTGALQVTGGVGVQGDIHATHANLEDVEADSVTVTDATAATSVTSGALQVVGGVGIQGDLYATDGTFTTNVYITNHTDLNNKHLAMIDTNGSLIQSPVYVAPSGKYVISAAEAEFLGNITLGGNTTLLTSTSLIVEDRIIGIGSNNSAEGLDSGIIIEHQDEGTFANVALIHHADEHRFSIGYTQNTLTDNHILNASHPDNVILRVDLIGNTIVQNSLSVSEMGTFGTKVGVATTEPNANIHVVGNVFVTSNISTASNVLITGDAAATSKTTGALQVAGGVGVQGDIYGVTVYTDDYLTHTDDTNTKIGFPANDTFTITTNNGERIRVNSSGSVGIGTASPIAGSNLHVFGQTTTISSDTTGSSASPEVTLYRDQTGSDGNYLGQLRYDGQNDNSADKLYGKITGKIKTATQGSEDGIIETTLITGGSQRISVRHSGDLFQIKNGTDFEVGEVANLYVDTATNSVGINTDSPAYNLDVRGTSNVGVFTTPDASVTDATPSSSKTTGALKVAGGVGVQGDLHADAAYISSNLNVDGTTLHVDSVSNRVGVGKTNPGFTLDVNGDINFSGGLNQGGSPFVSSPWTIAVNDDLSYTSGNVTVGTTLFHVDTQTSNIGIGKTDPGFTLDVNGDVNFSGSLYEGGSPFVSTPWTIDGNDLEYTSGNIGIGTNAAAATLHVGGNIYSTSNISAYEIEVSNVTTTNLTMNTIILSTTTSLDNTVTVSNITSNTVQFTNSDVGLVATGNVVANYFKGDGSQLTGIATTLQSVSDFGNTSSNTVQFTNATTGFVTTSNVTVGGIAKQTSVPAFTVRLTDGTIVGAGDIDYNQVDTDNTSSYTTVDGRFTAPVAGHYFFSAHGIYQNDVTVYDFTINGTRQNINALCSSPSANYIQCNISAVLNLSVGDYVNVYQVEGGTFGTDNNVFTGFFIG